MRLNDREFCGDGLETHKDRRSRWVLLVHITLAQRLRSSGTVVTDIGQKTVSSQPRFDLMTS